MVVAVVGLEPLEVRALGAITNDGLRSADPREPGSLRSPRLVSRASIESLGPHESFDWLVVDVNKLSAADARFLEAATHRWPTLALAHGPFELPPSFGAPTFLEVFFRRQDSLLRLAARTLGVPEPLASAWSSGSLGELVLERSENSELRRRGLELLSAIRPLDASSLFEALARRFVESGDGLELLRPLLTSLPRLAPDRDTLELLIDRDNGAVGEASLSALSLLDPKAAAPFALAWLARERLSNRRAAAEAAIQIAHARADASLAMRVVSARVPEELRRRAFRLRVAIGPIADAVNDSSRVGLELDPAALDRSALESAVEGLADPSALRGARARLRSAPSDLAERPLLLATETSSERGGLAAELLAERPGRATWGALLSRRDVLVDRGLLAAAVRSPHASLAAQLAESPSVALDVRAAALLHVCTQRNVTRAHALLEELADHAELSDAIAESARALGTNGLSIVARLAGSTADPVVRAEALAIASEVLEERVIVAASADPSDVVRAGAQAARVRREGVELGVIEAEAPSAGERRTIDLATYRAARDLGVSAYGLFERLARSETISVEARSLAIKALLERFERSDADEALRGVAAAVIARAFEVEALPDRTHPEPPAGDFQFLVRDLDVEETAGFVEATSIDVASSELAPSPRAESPPEVEARPEPRRSELESGSGAGVELAPPPASGRGRKMVPLEQARALLVSLIMEGPRGLQRIEVVARSALIPDSIRIDALHWLHHQLPKQRMVDVLRQALRARSVKVSIAAIGICGRLGDVLLSEIEDLAADARRAPEVRVRALGHAGSKRGKAEVVGLCQRLLVDPEPLVRRAALDGLFPSVRLLRGEALEAALVNLLERHESTTAKVSAALALGEFGSKRAVSHLSSHARGVFAVGRLSDAARASIKRIEARVGS
ncbi:MAG: HEAT repeat domain-containing protein [Deltaproteobacteria bacterium]|nr:HEAT repeat domain-containing protein [Deltaproteobacteria bacterium]